MLPSPPQPRSCTYSGITALSVRISILAAWVFAFAVSSPAASLANLLSDPSFELGVLPNCLPGQVPSPWFIGNQTPDTYSFDCATLEGVAPTAGGNFASLISAKEGLRFVAGANLAVGFEEAFGQAMVLPLFPEKEYTLSAFFARSDNWDSPGVYDFYLSPTQDFHDGLLMGTIASNAVTGEWTYDFFKFCAPSNSGFFLNLILVPRSLVIGGNSYIGTDDWRLIRTNTGVCEPVPTNSTSWGRVKSFYR